MEMKQDCAELFRDLDKRVVMTHDKVQKFMFDYAIKFQTLKERVDNHNVQLLRMCELMKQFVDM